MPMAALASGQYRHELKKHVRRRKWNGCLSATRWASHGRGGQPGRRWAERAPPQSNSDAHACAIAAAHYRCNRGVHR